MPYSVWRSSNYLRALRIGYERDWGSGNLGEFIYALCGISDGVHLIHDQLQWLRSTENSPQQAHMQRSISVAEWLPKLQVAGRGHWVKNFADHIVCHLSYDLSNISIQESQ